jgi:hypothetical protein
MWCVEVQVCAGQQFELWQKRGACDMVFPAAAAAAAAPVLLLTLMHQEGL